MLPGAQVFQVLPLARTQKRTLGLDSFELGIKFNLLRTLDRFGARQMPVDTVVSRRRRRQHGAQHQCDQADQLERNSQ